MHETPDIASLIIDLNKAVAEGNLNILDEMFHENIKILSQDMKILGDGKEACIKSYFEFLAANKIDTYKDNVDNIFIYENTAIVMYSYDITWSSNEKKYQEYGKEMYILTREKNNWYIIIRNLIGRG